MTCALTRSNVSVLTREKLQRHDLEIARKRLHQLIAEWDMPIEAAKLVAEAIGRISPIIKETGGEE